MMVGTFLVAQQLRLYTSTARGVGGFPGSLVGKESTCKGRRPQFNSWVGKICWRRERLPTLVFWLGEFHGLYSPWGRKESDTTEQLSLANESWRVE